MRTSERLRKLKAWITQELCEGRMLKTPDESFDITQIKMQQPQCFLGWPPRWALTAEESYDKLLLNVCPGILVMPNPSEGKFMEEKRFDRYNDIRRPKELGQSLAVSMLFSVYEPGVRLEGFVKAEGSAEEFDMTKLREGTEQGLFTLFDWMDDCRDKLLGSKGIPHTDLILEEESLIYSLYTDQSYVVDKRPIFYGFVNVKFRCFADEKTDPSITSLLD
jgi:hypothetical protein